MKRMFLAIAALTALTLTACSQNEFTDDAQKEEAFAAYTCKKSLESKVDQKNQAVSAAIKVLADENASKADRSKALKLNLKNTGADQIATEPLTLTLDGRTCEGWAWEQHLKYEKQEHFDSFTYEQAKNAGVFSE